ncbi:MAG: YgiT-type zinc finger protein [Betaproteobacteria bacterium]|nr:YgiT-type zinc finger protein [Betaproteobacteria bacterium]
MGARPKSSSSSASRARSTSSRSTSSKRRCASCGRVGVQLRRVTRTFGSGRNLLVVEGIPMWSCPHCGESYFTAQTMHELERMKTLRKTVAVRKPVSVAEYHQAGA